MTMDKSLQIRRGMNRARGVLTRAERLLSLTAAERWKEGDSPLGLPKVRVFKLSMKKKKKKKEEDEGAAGDAKKPDAKGGKAAAKPAAKPAGKK